ncbi:MULTISPECIES: DUF2152 domain-containing protein [Mycobacteriales]|mgnify:CR=1 FL=1|jgi:hypothetical protein|uniref:DUF2152 domain-containing protein n=1 Tax=Mycobacteriales TaxID=85007 RepID=UPI0021A80328|nr:DUF2152 domain-containing protein [Dietzia cinnamea]MCT1640881.1 DUF2152 domain-containing protein [Dietzia cinnamea]
MPASVTEPLTQLLSWTAWLASMYLLLKAILLAPQFAWEYREGRRGETSKKFFWWMVAAIVLATAGTTAQVVLN